MNKQSIFLILATIILGTAGFFYITHTSVSQKSIAPQYNTWQEARQAWLAYLDALENELWQELSTKGLSKETIQEIKNKEYDIYVEMYKRPYNKPVSEDIKKRIQPVFELFSVDSSRIQLIAWDRHPAAANDGIIYINEDDFNALSPDLQLFTIAHELQHCIYQDSSTIFFIYSRLPEAAKNISETSLPHNHLFLRYRRFTELRADLLAALVSKEWAERYLNLVIALPKLIGQESNIMKKAHPSLHERMLLAHNIIDQKPLKLLV